MDRLRKRIGIGLIATSVAIITTVLLAGGVSATPPSGLTSLVLSTGLTAYKTNLAVPPGTDVVTAQNTFMAGGFSGWHSHPGATVVTVVSGEITIFTEAVGGGACTSHTYTAGQTFYEWPKNMQNGVASVDTVVIATFFNVPHGGSARIDRDDPGNCVV